MNAPFVTKEYDYPTAFSGWGVEERAAIDRVCASNQFTTNREVKSLEYEFAEFHNMKHAIAVNSGSSANLIAVAALQEIGLETSRPIAVPALAWSTTYAPLVQHGFDLMLCDCDATWNMARSPEPPWRLIVTAPILGNAAYMDRWRDAAFRTNSVLLVDACESVGAKAEDGTLAGTQGLLNTFSFYYSHQMSAIEGGMILTNDDKLAEMCRILTNHGWTRGLRLAASIEDEYEFVAMGYNVRPIELHAAIARVQLGKLKSRIAARSENYLYWLRVTDGLQIRHPEIFGEPSFFGIHFQVKDRNTRTLLAQALRRSGVDCRPPVAGSFRRQPYGKPWEDKSTPCADEIHDTGLMIGNPPFDGRHLIDRAVAVMREVL